jgi:hypothetical protein
MVLLISAMGIAPSDKLDSHVNGAEDSFTLLLGEEEFQDNPPSSKSSIRVLGTLILPFISCFLGCSINSISDICSVIAFNSYRVFQKARGILMSWSCSFVNGNVFTLDLPGEQTIADAKRLIHQQFPEVDLQVLKLIFRSRILPDTLPLSEVGLFKGDVIIVQPRSMIPRTLPPFDPNPPVIQIPPEILKAPVSPDVEKLMAMGFPEAECIAALERCNGRVERAVERLLNPPEEQPPQQQMQRAIPQIPDLSGDGMGIVSAIQRLHGLAPEMPIEMIFEIYGQSGNNEQAAANVIREMVGG